MTERTANIPLRLSRSVRLGDRGRGLAATVALAALAVGVLVGRTVLLHPGRGIVGSNPADDFQIMTWSLRWWPWAVGHGVDPLRSPLLWPPEGFPTLWMTTIPFPALVALPVTLLAGPLVAYNALMLAAVLAASAAAYLLCFELTARPWPSLLGGLVFGLSPYMLGHTDSSHLNLVFVFPLPLLALLAVRLLRGKTSPRRYVAGTALLLLALAGSSLELFADLTLLVVVVGALALAFDRRRRAVLARLAKLVALSYAACLPVLGPIGIVMLAQAHGPVQGSPTSEAVDLLSLVVPTPLLLVGWHWTRDVSSQFIGNIGERDGYLGLPLVVVALLALRAHRRRGIWIAGLLGGVALVLSLGPSPTAEGRPLFTFPISAADLPVLGNALPARFSIFVALAVACLAALWFAEPGRRWLRVAVAAAVVASILPNVEPPSHLARAWAVTSHFAWTTPAPPPGFVDDPAWQSAVAPGTNVLVLPTRDRTPALWWQVKSGFGFSLAMPETPFAPPSLAAEPTVARLTDDVLPQLDGVALGAARLRAFVRAQGVGAVVVAQSAAALWPQTARRAVGVRPQRLRGALVYTVPANLPPLRVTGRPVVARVPNGETVRAWIAFDGRRAHLRTQVDGGTAATLSTPGGDAAAPAVAINRDGHAAVAFTEWRDGRQLLRVATTTGSGWRTTTLDSATLPIWSPTVTVTPDGTVAVVWVTVLGADRAQRAAVRPSGGGWQRTTLDSGNGLGGISMRAAGAGVVAVAWHDQLANEQRVQVTTWADGRWLPTTTVAREQQQLDTVRLTPHAAAVRWRAWEPTLTESFESRRTGSSWGPAVLRHSTSR